MTLYVQIAILLIVLMANKIAGTISDKSVIKKENNMIPIFDVWRDCIGSPLSRMAWIAELYLFVSVILGLVYIPNIKEFKRIINILSFLYGLKAICSLSTWGYISQRYNETKNKKKYFTNMNFSDLNISGHAMISFTCYLITLNELYKSEHGVLYDKYLLLTTGNFKITNTDTTAILVLPIPLITCLLVLLVGDHYTVDVILGIVISYLCYYSNLF